MFGSTNPDKQGCLKISIFFVWIFFYCFNMLILKINIKNIILIYILIIIKKNFPKTIAYLHNQENDSSTGQVLGLLFNGHKFESS
jgi:hypothetical protein